MVRLTVVIFLTIGIGICHTRVTLTDDLFDGNIDYYDYYPNMDRGKNGKDHWARRKLRKLIKQLGKSFKLKLHISVIRI